MPETSLIIRTLNEDKYLKDLLTSIHSQTYKNFEIINVDSGSTDETLNIANRFNCKSIHINPEDFTFGYSLNKGIEVASGKFIVIISAHTMPKNEFWLENLINPLKDTKVAMVFGKQEGGIHSNIGELKDLQRKYTNEKIELTTKNIFANNANSAIQKELWCNYKFNEILTAQEDIDWAKYWLEKDYKVIYEPKSSIYHYHNEKWDKVRNRYYRESLAYKKIKLWGKRHIIKFLLQELLFFNLDIIYAIRSKKLKDLFLFRINKSFGTLKGLFL